MLRARRVALLASVVAFAVAASACGGNGSPRVVTEGGAEVTFDPTREAAPTSEASPAPTEAASPVPTEQTPPTSTAEAPSEGPDEPDEPDEDATPRWGFSTDDDQPQTGDLQGSPHSTADVRAAVEAAGYAFRPVDVPALCASTSVPGQAVFTADPGEDTGPVFSLWVYPTSAGLQEDWSTGSGGVQPRTAGCSLPTGHVYWNGNALLAFHTWMSEGEDVGASGRAESPRQYRTVEAFLDLPR